MPGDIHTNPTAKTRLGVLVSGNGSNLQAILDAIENGTIQGDVRLVISNKPGVRALQRAEQANVPALCIPHKQFTSRQAFDDKLLEALQQADVEWVILAGFMRLLTDNFLSQFKDRVINLHPSLLPAFPGIDAGRQALDYGVKVSGCTVHLVTQDMDTGPIIAQRAVPVHDNDDEESLMQRIHAAEHQLLVEVVQAVCQGRLHVEYGSERPKVKLKP